MEDIRNDWLKGVSLRTLAKRVGISHTVLYSRLKAKYGADVCNETTHSLRRSLLRDYKDMPELQDAILSMPDSDRHYYALRADNVWSKNRQKENAIALDMIQHREYEYEPEPLRLELLIYTLTLTTLILRAYYGGFIPSDTQETEDVES